MENVQNKIHHLPIITRQNLQGTWTAQAMAQLNAKVDGIWIDGTMQELEPHTYYVGELIRHPLPGRSKDASAAFRVRTLIDKVGGRKNAEQVMLLGADVVLPSVPSSLILHPDETIILSVQPHVNGKATKFKFQVEALCGTCRGSGAVGFPGHQIICPICKEDPAFVMKPLLGKEPSHRLFVNELKIGMRSQFLGAGSIPLKALEDTNLVMDTCYVGQLMHLDITNKLDTSVRLSGEILFEEIEIKPEDFEENFKGLAEEGFIRQP